MEKSAENFKKNIAECAYPGRGLVMGLSEEGDYLQLYWIMGRSSNSRNRVFKSEGSRLWTEAADPSKMEDPSLIIYDCMLQHENRHIVSNGDQSTTIYESLRSGGCFESALRTRGREPDAPNYTPRISGLLNLEAETALFSFSILKKNSSDPELSDRHFFEVSEIKKGFGLCLTTYREDGNPLPSFAGEPYELPLLGSTDDILKKYWSALDEDNKISLALKKIDASNGEVSIQIKNR